METLGGKISIVNNLRPSKNGWAYDLFIKGANNNWLPVEKSMAQDIELWRSNKLSADERLLIKRVLGFFSASESLVGNNLVLNIFKYLNDGELRFYLSRQIYEECYKDGVCVLTYNGWKKIQDLEIGEKVAQFNKDETIEFVDYSNPVSYDYDGDLVNFYDKQGKVDLSVTPNHRMIGVTDANNIIIDTAENISYSNKSFWVAGQKKNGLDKLSDYDRFLISFQADGSFQSGKYRNGHRNGGFRVVTYGLTKERKQIRLRLLCEKLNFKYRESKPDTNGNINFRVWIPFSYAISKTLDWVKIKDVSYNWCQEFIEEIKNWDGWEAGDTVIGYGSTIKFNTDVVQIIGVLAGYKTHYYHHIDDRKESFSDMHTVRMQLFTNKICRGVISKKYEKYKGKVYCISVPSGFLVVSHNNKVMVSGNSLHSMTVSYVCDSLNLDVDEVYNAYINIEAIKNKDQFLMSITKDIGRKDFDIDSIAGKRELLRNIVTYYVICEGIFFYGAFASILAFKRRNMFPGLCEQITYSLRDEAVHLEFGVNLIHLLKKEYPELWDKQFELDTIEHIKTACDLEIAFCDECLPKGIVGLNKKNFLEYIRYLTDRRCQQIGLPVIHGEARNPFEWMTEVTDLPKMKNFFETQVQEYSTGGLIDDL